MCSTSSDRLKCAKMQNDFLNHYQLGFKLVTKSCCVRDYEFLEDTLCLVAVKSVCILHLILLNADKPHVKKFQELLSCVK